MDEKIYYHGDKHELNPSIEECSVQECIRRWKDKWYQRFNAEICVCHQSNNNENVSENQSYILTGESCQNMLIYQVNRKYLFILYILSVVFGCNCEILE